MIFLNKKGVSPLIATVLLIAFAVAIGSVVMTWGRGYVEEMQSTSQERSNAALECVNNVQLSLVDVGNEPTCLYNESAGLITVEFILENSPWRDIEKVDVRFFAIDDRIPLSFTLNDSMMKKSEAKFFEFAYDSSKGAPKMISLTPVISLGSREFSCDSATLTINDCGEK